MPNQHRQITGIKRKVSTKNSSGEHRQINSRRSNHSSFCVDWQQRYLHWRCDRSTCLAALRPCFTSLVGCVCWSLPRLGSRVLWTTNVKVPHWAENCLLPKLFESYWISTHFFYAIAAAIEQDINETMKLSFLPFVENANLNLELILWQIIGILKFRIMLLLLLAIEDSKPKLVKRKIAEDKVTQFVHFTKL